MVLGEVAGEEDEEGGDEEGLEDGEGEVDDLDCGESDEVAGEEGGQNTEADVGGEEGQELEESALHV